MQFQQGHLKCVPPNFTEAKFYYTEMLIQVLHFLHYLDTIEGTFD